MCFNWKVSLLTFFIGLIGSISLVKYGSSKFRKENQMFGVFMVFIAAIQLMDFFFWIDLNNSIGINGFVTLIGPLLNIGQPLILYVTKLLLADKKDIHPLSLPQLPVTVLNAFYAVFLVSMYQQFVTSTKPLTTGVKNGHLKWPWLKYTNPYFYLVVLAVNIFYLSNFSYSLIVFVVTYALLFLSAKYFQYHTGELWCFFGAFVPFITLFLTNHLL